MMDHFREAARWEHDYWDPMGLCFKGDQPEWLLPN